MNQFFSDSIQPQTSLMKNFGAGTLLFTENPKQKMLGADVAVVEPLRFLGSVGEDPLALNGERKVKGWTIVRPDRDTLLDLDAHAIRMIDRVQSG